MRLLENTRISTKIVSLLMMLGAITLFIAWNGSSSIKQADRTYAGLINVNMPDTTRMARINARMNAVVYAGYRALVNDGASVQAKDASDRVDSAYKSATDMLAEIRRTEPAMAGKVDGIGEKAAEIYALSRRAADFGLRNENDKARRLLSEADPLMIRFSKDMQALTDSRNAAVSETSKKLSASAESTSLSMLLMGVVGVMSGIGIAIVVSRVGITGPLSQLRTLMEEIAAGDYRKEVDGTSRGDEVGAMAKTVLVFRDNGIAKDKADAAKQQSDAEQKMVVDTVATHLSDLSDGDLTRPIATEFPPHYAALKDNFNDALAKLRELIGAVSESAATIRTGSGEIAQASEDLARRTESNAASLEETAASVTQMDGRLRASATSATRTVQRADQAIGTVVDGRTVADEAVQAMGRVAESAKGIDSVIEGLDKIAFQTRVLAMNAAVEAGRAGDAGRGFAVAVAPR